MKDRRAAAAGIILIVGVALALFIGDGTREIYGLSEGTYAMAAPEEPSLSTLLGARITFDMETYTFDFSYDLLSSYWPHGTFDIEDGRVIAATDDGKYRYVFEIVDNDTIRFLQSGSSPVNMIQGEAAVKDGAEFKFTDQR